MADKDGSRVLVEELRRVLGEFRTLDDRIAELASDRKQRALVAHRLAQILRQQFGAAAAGRIIAEAGLAADMDRLPGVPGRKPSLAETPAPAPRTRRQAGKATRRAPATRRRAAAAAPDAPFDLVAKNTPIQMLTGIYKGWTGAIRWTRIQGQKVTYTASLVGPGGQKGRTQVAHTSLGASWKIAGGTPRPAAGPAPAAAPEVPRAPRPSTIVRRREGKSQRTVVTAPAATTAAPAPTPAADAGARAVPAGGPVPKGTAIRMLAGIYQGFQGKVASVQAKTGRQGTEAIYMLALVGPDGRRARTSVKHSSLGRMWARA